MRIASSAFKLWRPFSWASRFERNQMDKAADQFRKEINFLASKQDYTLQDYKQRVIDQLSQSKKGIKAQLTNTDDKGEAHMVRQRKILNAMFEDELKDYDAITAEKKRDIASVAECDISEVNTLLRSFRQMRDMQNWLRDKKEAGKELPTNQSELKNSFREDKPMNRKDKLDQKRGFRWNKQDTKKMLKWGQPAVIKQKQSR